MPATVIVRIYGPSFHKAAVELGHHLAIGSIRELQAFVESETEAARLKPALVHLRNYLAPNGTITTFVSQDPGASLPPAFSIVALPFGTVPRKLNEGKGWQIFEDPLPIESAMQEMQARMLQAFKTSSVMEAR